MPTSLTAFPSDRTQRWILVPGVASTRQIEIRNETDTPVEAHLRVEQPPAASVSPGIMTIPPRHSRVADVLFLATWSPDGQGQLALSFRDVQGNDLGAFTQEIVAADSVDCNLSLELKDDVMVDQALIGLKLWCTLVSRSSTPRRFEVDFTPHPALRFPERKTITLAPGETSAFDIPVQWNRAVRDMSGWNHPRSIEAFVPVTEGRRAAVIAWERLEQRLAQYLNPEDRQARIVVATAPERRNDFLEKTPGQLKYEELVELRRLEQSVVAPPTARATTKLADDVRTAPPGRRSPVATVVTIAFAVVALVLAGFFFLRPPGHQADDSPISVSPLKLTPALGSRVTPAKAHAKSALHPPAANPAWTSVGAAALSPTTVTPAVARHATPPATRTAPSQAHPQPAAQPPIDRNQVVALSGVEAAYEPGGRAVSVAWDGSAQASARVELVDFTGKIIASHAIRGTGAQAVLHLPRGYHGPLSVNVTAFGYHGERVVQTASLSSPE